MKPTSIYGLTLAAFGLVLASCTQIPARVNDKPFAIRPQQPQPTVQPTVNPSANPLDQWNQPTGFTPTQPVPAVTDNTGATTPTPNLSVVPDPPKPITTPVTPGIGTGTPSISTAIQPTVASQHPVAVPVPGNPLEVYSPSDRSKTIRIVDKNGQRQPSGKKLYDPYSPTKKSIFIVP